MKKFIAMAVVTFSIQSFGQIIKPTPTPISTPTPINKELAQFIVEQKQFNNEARTKLQGIDARQSKAEAGVSRIEEKLSQMEQRQIQMLELLQNQESSDTEWIAIPETNLKRKFFDANTVALKSPTWGRILINNSHIFSTAEEIQNFCAQHKGFVPSYMNMIAFARTMGQSPSQFSYMLTQYTGLNSNAARAAWVNKDGIIQVNDMYSSQMNGSGVINLCEI